MSLSGKKKSLMMLAGDLAVFVAALWLALWLRYFEWPSQALFLAHLRAFAPLYGIWLIVFFISDLYRRQTLILTRQLPQAILRAQLVNSLLAVFMFYFNLTPAGITPKTNLFIYLLTTLLLLGFWRLYLVDWLSPRRQITINFAASGTAVNELEQEIRDNPRHRLLLADDKASMIVFNKYDGRQDHLLPDFYRRFFRGTRFVPVHDFYETLFERVPLSLVNEKWFLENISNQPKLTYSLIKRGLDIILSGVLAILSLPFYLVVPLFIKLEDGGPIFYRDERVGRHGRDFFVYKFRSMSTEPEINARHVTRVGAFLRRTRLDELPQLWSVLRGDQSLIGPRPERPDYVAIYREQIPYYDARHLIAPGLSGWAQLYQVNHPHFRSDLAGTEEKLSYDLYYLKNRGWWLDLKIALKTIRTLLSRSGI